MRWTVVIPAKALPEAKSRLTPVSRDPGAHRLLVEAIRSDTIAAATAATAVARVLLVVDRPQAAAGFETVTTVVQQVTPGLNGALRDAAAFAALSWPGDGVAALVGDLPALRPEELTAALDAAAQHRRAFVTDAPGTGTTLLAAVAPDDLAPQFGAGSAERHARDATALRAGPGLRHDVDTAHDLDAAGRFGLGPATLRALADNVIVASSP